MPSSFLPQVNVSTEKCPSNDMDKGPAPTCISDNTRMVENDIELESCDSATPTLSVESVSSLTSPDEMTPETTASESVKTENVLDEKYVSGACDTQIGESSQEERQRVVYFDLIPNLIEGMHNIQNVIIRDRNYITERSAPINSEVLAGHYNYLRNTDSGRTTTGRRLQMKQLVDVMDVICEA